MTRLMAPILSFTAEEVWQSIKHRAESTGQGKEDFGESVFLARFPHVDEEFLDQKLEEKWDDLFKLRNEVNKALEIKRAEKFLGNPLEAKILLRLPGKYENLLPDEIALAYLPTFFIVSAVELADKSIEDAYRSTEIGGLEIKVERAAGAKCQRCWNWSEAVGTFADAPDICERCYKVVKQP